MLKVAPEPLPLVPVCEMLENVDAPLAVPLNSTSVIPEEAVPEADALIAPDTGEFPEAEAAVTLPIKSKSKLPDTKTK